MKFTEAQLESAIIELLGAEGYPHVLGEAIERQPQEVLIKADLRAFLAKQYAADRITTQEIEAVIKQLETYSAADLYESNKAIMKLVSDGFLLKREDRNQKDLYIQLIDYSELVAFREPNPGEVPTIVAEDPAVYSGSRNIFKIVNQLEIVGHEKRIPDGILYINGLPLVVFEFKSAIREEATIHDAFVQLTVRYQRDIPELFKYNAFCVISDGVNNKVGAFFAPYKFIYAWRKTKIIALPLCLLKDTQYLPEESLVEDSEINLEATCKNYLQVRLEGKRELKRQIKHNNLEAAA